MLDVICWILAEFVLLMKRLIAWNEDHAGIVILVLTIIVIATFLIALAIIT